MRQSSCGEMAAESLNTLDATIQMLFVKVVEFVVIVEEPCNLIRGTNERIHRRECIDEQEHYARTKTDMY